MQINEIAAWRRREKQENPEAYRFRERFHEANVERMYRDTEKLICWPTHAEVAQWFDVHRAQITRAVARGQLNTNGLKGKSSRIDPMTLWYYSHAREARERAQDDAWAEGRI